MTRAEIVDYFVNEDEDLVAYSVDGLVPTLDIDEIGTTEVRIISDVPGYKGDIAPVMIVLLAYTLKRMILTSPFERNIDGWEDFFDSLEYEVHRPDEGTVIIERSK